MKATPVQAREAVRTNHELATQPTGWILQQCAECKMIFALPPFDEESGLEAMDRITNELDRHILQNHGVDLPSAWKAEDQLN